MFAAARHTVLVALAVALIVGTVGGPAQAQRRDNKAPSTPTNLRALSATTSTIVVIWNPSTDNVGVTGYHVFAKGTVIQTSQTRHTVSGLFCGMSVQVSVRAFDAAGNRSSWATAVVATAPCPPPDTTPPSPPSSLAASNVTATSLTLSWNASSDNVGVTTYDVYRDGAAVASVTSTSSQQTGLTCGTGYVFGVEAVDAAGNRSSRTEHAATTAACPPPPPPSGDLGSALPARMPESTGQVFYISPSGNDAHPGTQAAPWRTIQKAVDTLQAGQKALVGPGAYAEALNVIRNLGGPEPATIEAQEPGNRPVITRQMQLQQSGSTAAAYWRFRNLVFDGTANGDRYGIRITSNLSAAYVPHDIEIYGVEIRNVSSGLDKPQGLSIAGNGTSKTTIPHRIHLYNSRIHRIAEGATNPDLSHAVYVANCGDCVFANTVLHDNPGYGFRIGGGSTSEMSTRDSIFVNNTIADNTLKGGITVYEDASGTPANYLAGGNRFYNNIVFNVPRVAYQSSFLAAVNGPADSYNLWDENLAYRYGTLYANGDGGDVSSTFVSSPTDSDPLLANPAANDFRLGLGSPAIGAGLPEYTPPFDFDGNPRARADLGAFGG